MDKDVIELFLQRDENAIGQTKQKYGNMCFSVAYGILRNREDAEECVSDALLALWKSIPPEKPCKLGAYAAKITRNIALNRFRALSAQKRGNGEIAAAIEELEECIPDKNAVSESDSRAIAEALNAFLATLKKDERIIFVSRYWGMKKISEIASDSGFSESKIKTSLSRTREKLRIYLKKEDIPI